MHPKFDLIGVQTHDLVPPDHDSTFHVTETPALTTQPSVTTLQSQTRLIWHSNSPIGNKQ